MNPMRWTRRGALLAAGGALAAPAAFAAERADVVVIGAGLAGLATARALQKVGAKVIVLEGSSRIGGRVQTADGVEMRPELGATQIGGSYARIIATAKELGVGLEPEDRDIEPFAFSINGALVAEKDWAASPANRTVGKERETSPMRLGTGAMTRLNPLKGIEDWLAPKHLKYDVAIGALMRESGMSEEAIRLAELGGAGGDVWGVSALAMFQEQTRTAYEYVKAGIKPGEKSVTYAQDPNRVLTMVVKGGTSRLTEAMAASLKTPVRTRELASAVLQDASGVEVRTMTGGRYRASHVVCAVPFHMLRMVAFEPAPGAKLTDAIHSLRTAHTSRAWLSVSKPFWEQDGLAPSLFTDEGIGMLWVFNNAKSGRPDWKAMIVTTGDAARRFDSIPDAERPAYALAELARIRPSTKGALTWLTYKSWTKEPLIQACRGIYGPGQIARFREAMWESHGRVHFAGEQCRRLDQGMEAALESAEAAARRIAAA